MDKNKKYRKDQCQCGKEKDKRAKLCGVCRAALNVNAKKEKVCNGCGKLYPIDEYNLRIKGSSTTRRSRCKKCLAEYNKKRAQEYPEKIRTTNRLYALKHPEKIRVWSIRSRWKRLGYDPDEIENFICEHKCGCEICGSFNKLFVDHDHKTGKIRGMLCGECNFGLGKFKDDMGLLASAINYLRLNL
jgi:hypothetical protein